MPGSHGPAPGKGLNLDALDAKLRLMLAVTVAPVLVLLGLVGKAANLLALALRDNRRHDFRAGKRGRADLQAVVSAYHEHLGQLHGRLRLSLQLFDGDGVAGRYLILLAARPDDRIHRFTPSNPTEVNG